MARGKQKQIPFFPANLDTADFRALWEQWETHRREKRATLTDTTRRAQLEQCAAWGLERAMAAMKNSMLQGWTGLFEPRSRGFQPQPPPAVLPGYRKPAPDQKEEAARVKAYNAEVLRVLAEIPDEDVRRLHEEVLRRDPKLRKYLEKANPRETPGLRGAIVELWKAEQSGTG